MSCGGTTGSAQPVYISSLPPRFLNGVRSLLDRVHERQPLLRVREIAIVVDGADVPVRIVEQEVRNKPTRVGSCGSMSTAASSGSRASPNPSLPRGQPVKICSPVRGFFAPSYIFLDRLDLRRREAGRLVARPLAGERRRVERALARIVDQAVLQRVVGVARGDGRLRDSASFAA